MMRSSSAPDCLELRSSPRVLAPDWAERLKAIPGPAWLLVLVFLVVLIAHDPRGNAWVAAVSAVVVLFFGPVVMKALNTRVIIKTDYVECRDALRRARGCKRSELVTLRTVRIQVLGPRFGLTRVLMLDRAGNVRLHLQVDAWSDDQLHRIYDALGLPLVDTPQPLGPRQANQEYPGSASVLLRVWPLVALGAFILTAIGLGGLSLVLGR